MRKVILFMFLTYISIISQSEWTKLNYPDYYDINTIQFLDENIGWVGGSFLRIWKTTDGGKSWEMQLQNSHNYPIKEIVMLDENTGWAASTLLFNLLKTSDGGSNWDEILVADNFEGFTNLEILNDSIIFTSELMIHNRIAKSTDGGNSWKFTALNAPIYDMDFNQNGIGWVLLFKKGNPFEGTMDSLHLYKTHDFGENWESINSFIGSTGKVKFFDKNFGCLLIKDEIYISLDGGNNWSKKNNPDNLSILPFFKDLEFIDKNTILIVGGDGNGAIALISYDKGESWHVDFKTQSPSEFTAISIVDNYNVFIAGTGSVFKRDLAITDIKNSIQTKKEFYISQNYPNPFNPSTQIKFSIPELTNVKIRIYNSIGEQIKNLVDKEYSAGYYETIWNAQNQPSGIYFIKIDAQSAVSEKHYSETKKAILLK